MSSPPPHPLTFRVMRLTAATPSRRPTLPFVCSQPEAQAAAPVPDAFLRDAPPCEGEGVPGSVGTACILPSSFGSIYASETFRSFISTYNFSQRPVSAVAVSIEIQTSSQRRLSLVSTRVATNLPPGEAVTHVVSSTLPELGVHVLICSATYMDRTGAPRTFRQLFRFNVLPPLEPFVNVVPLHRRRGLVPHHSGVQPIASATRHSSTMAQFLIDLRILNTMPVPVYITSARLEVTPGYTIVMPLLRSDDPAAQIAAADSLPERPESRVAESVETDPCLGGTACDGNSPPLRAASTGVGDTRNYLFYVARPLDASEKQLGSALLEKPQKSTSTPVRLGISRTDNCSHASPRLVNEASPAPAAANSRRDTVNTDTTTLVNTQSVNPLMSRKQSHAEEAQRREIGYFSLRWHSGTGERGEMENVIAAFEPVSKTAGIELRIAAVPQDVRMQVPFAARCIAKNNSPNPVRLYLQVRRDLVGEIVPVGISGISLGEVRPDDTAECLLSLIALSRGQHSISGVRVVDIDSRQSFNADPPVIAVL